MPSENWEEWLNEDAIDIDFLEKVEAQHFNERDRKDGENWGEKRLVMLECSGSQALTSTLCSSTSIVPSGALAALVQKGYVSSLEELCKSSVSVRNGLPFVFGMPCSPEMLTFKRNHFICGVRQNIHALEQMCNKVSSLGVPQSNRGTKPEVLRKEVSTFYHCLLCFISDEMRSSQVDPADEALRMLCGAVAADVLSLLVDIRQMAHLQQHVTAAVSRLGNECVSAAYHLFHLHLDIRWWSLAILHSIEFTVGRIVSPPLPPHCTAPPLLTEPSAVSSATEGQAFSGSAAGDSHLTQCVVFVVWDLITLMAREAKSCSVAYEGDGAGLPCGCCYEVALAALVLTQQRRGAQGFWEIVGPRLLLLSHGRFEAAPPTSLPSLNKFPPPELRSLDPAVVFEMLLTFAKLFCYNERGRAVSVKHSRVVPEPQTLLELLQQLLSRPAPLASSNGNSGSSGNSSGGSCASGNGSTGSKQHLPEEVLRRVLRCCVRLAVLWEGENKTMLWAMLLWERCFARSLDSSFLLTGTVQGLASVSPSVREWVLGARQRCETPSEFPDTESSWGLFLRLIGVVVKRGGHKAWLSVKGRVLAKLSSKRLSELRSSGIYNTTCLLLTLALTSNMAPTARLACELLCGTVKTSSSLPSLGGGRLVMFLRAELSVLLLLAESDCDLHCAVPPLLELVAELVELHAATRDMVLKREVGRALCSYCAAAAEVSCSSSSLGRGQHALFDEWLGKFLAVCCSSDQHQVLCSVTQALSPVIHQSDTAKAPSGGLLVACIERSVGSFLRDQSTTLTPPQELADAGAALTLAHASLATALGSVATVVPASLVALANTNEASAEASAKIPKRPEFRVNHKEAATSLFSHFLCNDRVKASCQLRYLGVLLLPSLLPRPPCVQGTRVLVSQVVLAPQQEEVMVSRFFCLAVTLGNDNTELLALVPEVLGVGVMRGYLPAPPACPFAALSALLKGMAQEYRNAPSAQSKHSVQRCCMSLLQGLDRAVQTVVQQTPPPAHLSLLLQALADAALHAPALLHIKSRGANSPLASWLTSAVLTKASYRLDVALPLHFTRALQPALPSFVLGLCSLPLQQDPFAARLARSVLINYMHCYPPSHRHPCLVMLCGVEGAEPAALERVRALMLSVLNTEFFSKKWATGHHRLHIALQVLQTALVVLEGGSSSLEAHTVGQADVSGMQWCVEAITTMLPPLLRLLLASEDRLTNRCVTELLRAMFDVARRLGAPDLPRLVSCVEELVRSQLSWQSSKVFAVLTGLCVLHRPLVAAALPMVFDAVIATELKRGTGVDMQLREMYSKLEEKVSAAP